MSYLAKNYNRKKIAFKFGKGSYLFSTDGKKYLDMLSGIAVNSLGHAHPKLVKTIRDQSKKLWHVSNAFLIPEGEKLSEKLAKKTLLTLLCFKTVEQKQPRLPLKLPEDTFFQLVNQKKIEFYA